MNRRTLAASLMLLVVSVVTRSAFAAPCYPTHWFQNAPDTLDTSNCQGWFPSYTLTKISHWTIAWRNDHGTEPIYTYENAKGFGQCTPSLFCWPSFHPPEASDRLWKQKIQDATLNCSDPGGSGCTACKKGRNTF
jgi:hypothetical protein